MCTNASRMKGNIGHGNIADGLSEVPEGGGVEMTRMAQNFNRMVQSLKETQQIEAQMAVNPYYEPGQIMMAIPSAPEPDRAVVISVGDMDEVKT